MYFTNLCLEDANTHHSGIKGFCRLVPLEMNGYIVESLYTRPEYRGQGTLVFGEYVK